MGAGELGQPLEGGRQTGKPQIPAPGPARLLLAPPSLREATRPQPASLPSKQASLGPPLSSGWEVRVQSGERMHLRLAALPQPTAPELQQEAASGAGLQSAHCAPGAPAASCPHRPRPAEPTPSPGVTAAICTVGGGYYRCHHEDDGDTEGQHCPRGQVCASETSRHMLRANNCPRGHLEPGPQGQEAELAQEDPASS